MSDGIARLAELEARLDKLALAVRAELPERAQALRAAVDRLSGDEVAERAAIQRIAHMVRGTAGSHGISQLTEPAARVESLAPNATIVELVGAARSLADLLDRAAVEAPRKAAPSVPPSASAPSAPIKRPLEGVRVLAIDDDAPTRRLLAMTLTNLGGASASIEHSASAFFAALEQHAYDVVIVDAMMPETNGLACLERIAGSPFARPSTRYFVLSAATPDELGWTLPETLAVSWLRKPFRPRELLDAIRAQLGA